MQSRSVTGQASWFAFLRLDSQKPRGLLDALLVVILLYGVYAKTPIGALAERAIRTAMGHRHLPSLFEAFRGREAPVVLDSSYTLKSQDPLADNPNILSAASNNAVPVELLVAAVQAHGQCEKDTCQIKQPHAWRDSLSHKKKQSTSQKENALIPIDTYARALAQAREELDDNPEAAVESLYVGFDQVIRAIQVAQQSEQKNADQIQVHAAYFSPGLRLGPLQDALAVLTRFRLLSLAWPMDHQYKISSGFGERLHPTLNIKRFHDGVDVAAPEGVPVKSAQRGKVQRVSLDSVRGLYVIVDHGLGIRTSYCHLSRIEVRTDQVVRQLQLLGRVGSTGRTTGSHLHYSLRVAGKLVNPVAYGYAKR